MSLIEQLRDQLSRAAATEGLLDDQIDVTLTPLTTEQAIGKPERQDFPIQKGKEKVIEARFRDFRGQAFSDELTANSCTVKELLDLDLLKKANQALFTAASNAVFRSLGLCAGTVHCRDAEPGQCAGELPSYIRKNFPEAKSIGLVGQQPAMAQALADAGFDLKVFDLDPDNIGKQKFGTVIIDGEQAAQYLPECDLVLATGSTLANGSIEKVLADAGSVPVVFFGISISSAASILGLRRYCPYGK